MSQPFHSDQSIDESVARSSMRVRITQMPRGLLAILLGVIALDFGLRGRVNVTTFRVWELLTVVGAIPRALLCVIIRSLIDKSSIEQLEQYDLFLSFSTTVSSAIMGCAFWLVATTGDDVVDMIITMTSIILTVATITAAPTSYTLLAIGAVLNLGQNALFWFGVGWNHPSQPVVGLMILIFLALFLTFARDHAAQFRESVRMRTENLSLLSNLEREKQIVEHALGEAHRASESKTRFLAAASHDLRQPLHALTMFLGTMTFHVTTDDAKRLLGRIKDTVHVLEEQFDSLLDLSRFDAGVVVAHIKPFRLDHSIERLADEVRPMAEAKHLQLTATVCPAIANSDPLLVGRLLRNLVDNAVKYTPAGSVTVRATQQSNAFLVEVIDTGPGIAPDQQTRIFDEYVQLTNPARQRSHGVGLGLAIVKRIDLLLGLNLSLRSTLGDGCRFSFVVPAAVGNVSIQSSNAQNSPATFATPVSVWILDDDTNALESLQQQLAAWGASVSVFSSPQDLLAEVRAGTALPDWICTDDMLGTPLSGLETAQLLSSVFGFDKVCLITGNTEPRRLAELRSSGFPVIVKPAKPNELMRVLSELESWPSPSTGLPQPMPM